MQRARGRLDRAEVERVSASEQLEMARAEVLRATAAGVSGGAWIFRGMAIGAAVKLLVFGSPVFVIFQECIDPGAQPVILSPQ